MFDFNFTLFENSVTGLAPQPPYLDLLTVLLTVQTLLLAVLSVAVVFRTGFGETGHSLGMPASTFGWWITAAMVLTWVGSAACWLGAFWPLSDELPLTIGVVALAGGATAQPVIAALVSKGLR